MKKEDVEQRIAQGIESRVRGLDEEAADDAVKEAYETLLPKAKLKAQVPMLTEEIVRGERRLVTAEKTKR